MHVCNCYTKVFRDGANNRGPLWSLGFSHSMVRFSSSTLKQTTWTMATIESPRILIADDDRVIRSYLSTVLNASGYLPLQAEDGRTTLSMLSRMPIDLLLLDLYMPDTQGLEILHAVRTRWATIPVILITGMASIDSAVAAIRQGAVDYLSKPFQIEKLLLVISRALEERNGLLQSNNSAPARAADPVRPPSRNARPENGRSRETATLIPGVQPTTISRPVLTTVAAPPQPGESLPKPKVPSRQVCYHCRCKALFPSKTHRWGWLLRLLLYRPHRCEVCLRRQWCWG